MAKVVGLVGSASGKIGNIVYAVTNGIQVARVYQPVVSNPKSSLQNMQRAKGNLVGRISSFVPRTALMGLGQNNRQRRGEFLRNLLNVASVNLVGNVYKAKVADVDVIFSKGATPILTSSYTSSAAAHSLSVTLVGSDAISSDVYEALQCRIVAMIYDSVTLDLVEVITKMATKPNAGSSAVTTLSVAHNGGFSAVVYFIPMSTADGSSVSISTDMAEKSDSDIAAELSVNRNAVVFDYGRSIYAGYSNYVPA